MYPDIWLPFDLSKFALQVFILAGQTRADDSKEEKRIFLKQELKWTSRVNYQQAELKEKERAPTC